MTSGASMPVTAVLSLRIAEGTTSARLGTSAGVSSSKKPSSRSIAV